MNLIAEKEKRNKFLYEIYKEAKAGCPTSPTSAYFGLAKYRKYKMKTGEFLNDDKEKGGYIIGEKLGLSQDEVDSIVIYFSDRQVGYMSSTLGLGKFNITQRGIMYLESLEEDQYYPVQIHNSSISFGDNANAQIQQNTSNSNQNIMKQSEKLDLILRWLYDYKDDGHYYSIVGICKELNIPLAIEDWNRLAHRLKENGYVLTIFQHNDCSLQLTSEGIDYCEQDSYTYSGKSIITNNYNISVVNSPGSNIINQSQNVSIEQNFDEALQLVDKIKDIISNDNSVDQKKMDEIIECLTEIKDSIKNKQKPKFAIKSLLDIAGGIASIASYLTTLGQFVGIIPPLP